MLLLHTGKSRFDVDGLCWTRFENVGHIYRDGTTCSQPSARVTHHRQYSQRLAEICEIKWRDVVLVAHRAIRRISHRRSLPPTLQPLRLPLSPPLLFTDSISAPSRHASPVTSSRPMCPSRVRRWRAFRVRWLAHRCQRRDALGSCYSSFGALASATLTCHAIAEPYLPFRGV